LTENGVLLKPCKIVSARKRYRGVLFNKASRRKYLGKWKGVMRMATKKPAKKAAPKKAAPKKMAPKKAVKKAAPAKKKAAPAKKKASASKAKKAPSKKAGSKLYCDTCGIVLTVDETCDCGACDIICCGEEMQLKY
jgi:hypothetical protein